jgi:hypothetical protein
MSFREHMHVSEVTHLGPTEQGDDRSTGAPVRAGAGPTKVAVGGR